MKTNHKEPQKGKIKVLYSLLEPGKVYTFKEICKIAHENDCGQYTPQNLIGSTYLEKVEDGKFKRPLPNQVETVYARIAKIPDVSGITFESHELRKLGLSSINGLMEDFQDMASINEVFIKVQDSNGNYYHINFVRKRPVKELA